MVLRRALIGAFLAGSLATASANACEYLGEDGIPDIDLITERLTDQHTNLPSLNLLRPVKTTRGYAKTLMLLPYNKESELVLIRKVSDALVQAHFQHSVQILEEPDAEGQMNGYNVGGGIYEYDIMIGEPCSAVLRSVKLVQELKTTPNWTAIPKSFSMFQKLTISEEETEELCTKFGSGWDFCQ